MKKLYKITSLILIVGIMVFVFPNKAEAAIGFDVAATGAGDDSTTCSISITVGASGTNRLLVVGVSAQDATLANRNVSTVKTGVIDFTQAVETDNPNDHVEIWYLINPATGAHTITITFGGASAGSRCGAVSLTGVNQTTPLDATQTGTGTGTTQSLSITTVANNSWIVDNVAIAGTGATTMTAATGRTQRWNGLDGFDEAPRGAGSTQGAITPAGATTMEWTTATSRVWALVAASFAPVADVTTTATPQLSLIDSQYFKIEDGFLSIIN